MHANSTPGLETIKAVKFSSRFNENQIKDFLQRICQLYYLAFCKYYVFPQYFSAKFDDSRIQSKESNFTEWRRVVI